MRLIALLSCAALLAACGGDDERASEPARGPTRGGRQASGATVVTPSPREAPRARGPSAIDPAPPGAPAETAEPAAPAPPSEGALQRPPPRDLDAELQAAIGAPTHCVALETARGLGDQLRLTVVAYVSAMGRVTRAEVQGAAPDAVRECVRRVAEGVVLSGPIAGAPLDVRAELVFDVRVEDPTVRSEPPPTALPPGAQAPGITLPAVGAQDRPPGFVPPSSTLPAAGAEDRPPGFVPPSSTLPAMGEPLPR